MEVILADFLNVGDSMAYKLPHTHQLICCMHRAGQSAVSSF